MRILETMCGGVGLDVKYPNMVMRLWVIKANKVRQIQPAIQIHWNDNKYEICAPTDKSATLKK